MSSSIDFRPVFAQVTAPGYISTQAQISTNLIEHQTISNPRLYSSCKSLNSLCYYDALLIFIPYNDFWPRMEAWNLKKKNKDYYHIFIFSNLSSANLIIVGKAIKSSTYWPDSEGARCRTISEFEVIK